MAGFFCGISRTPCRHKTKKRAGCWPELAEMWKVTRCIFSIFSPLLAEQDVALFGVAWFRCGWDRRWGRLLIAVGQCLIGYVPLVSNVGARAVNGAVWVSAVVLVVIVKGSLIRWKCQCEKIYWVQFTDLKGAVLGSFSHRFHTAGGWITKLRKALWLFFCFFKKGSFRVMCVFAQTLSKSEASDTGRLWVWSGASSYQKL